MTTDRMTAPIRGAIRITTYRHSAVVRATHWINAVALLVLLMSGLQIFNAHPALYLGSISDFDHPVLVIGTEQKPDGSARGVVQAFGHTLDTTGVLGLSRGRGGVASARAFPAWMTLPPWQSLAEGRRFHFFFAWIFVINTLVYAAWALLGGHVRRDLLPSWRDLRAIPHEIRQHARLRFPTGEAARRYNVLQRLTYLVVIFVLFPALVLAGLAMSPRMDAAFPQLLTLFGGRQTARTVHFIAAFSLLAFVLVHLAMVVLSGAWNNVRSMVTGRYVIDVPETAMNETRHE